MKVKKPKLKTLKKLKREAKKKDIRNLYKSLSKHLETFTPTDYIDPHDAFPNIDINIIYHNIFDALTGALDDTLYLEMYNLRQEHLDRFITVIASYELVQYLEVISNSYDSDKYPLGSYKYITDTIHESQDNLEILKNGYECTIARFFE